MAPASIRFPSPHSPSPTKPPISIFLVIISLFPSSFDTSVLISWTMDLLPWLDTISRTVGFLVISDNYRGIYKDTYVCTTTKYSIRLCDVSDNSSKKNKNSSREYARIALKVFLSHCSLSIHYVESYNSYLKRWNEHWSFWYLALFLREWHAQASSAHFLRSIVNSWRRRKSNAPRQNPVHEYRADENIRREREARVSLASMLMSSSSLDSCEILMHCKGLPGKFLTSHS